MILNKTENLFLMKNCYLALIVAFLLSNVTFAQINPDEVTIIKTEVADSIFMLEGRGGNIMIAMTSKELFMVDSQFAPLSDKLKETIATISNMPITYLINTHHHGDHTGGNENFNADETTIVAQANVLKRLTESGKATGFLPEITLEEKLKLNVPEDPDIMIVHVHNAHTDGDSFVYFTDKNVVHMGDVFFKDRYPFIDLNSGGSIDGYIAAQQLILQTINEDTQIIPGHGKLAHMDDLKASIRMLKDLRNAISLAISKGQTKDQVVASSSITQRYEDLGYGDGFINSKRIKTTIYDSLKNPNTDQ